MNPFRYCGSYYDTETELYVFKTRYYDFEVGRFITVDDLQYIDPEHISPKKIAMYSAKKIAIKRTIVNAAARFPTSILTGIGIGKGLGLAFGW